MDKKKIIAGSMIVLMIIGIFVFILNFTHSTALADDSVPRLKSGTPIFIGPGPTYEDGCDCTYWANQCFCILKK